MQVDIRKIRKRLLVLLIAATVIIILLAVRVGYWSLYKGEWLQEMAESQWITDSVVEAKRGSITDRNGNLLAQSASSDTVVLVPERIEDAQSLSVQLAEILEMPAESVYEKASNLERSEIWLKRQIASEQSEKISSLGAKGVRLISDVTRYYPNKSLAAQVVGYTTVDGEGQMGIEKRYDSILAGRQGRIVAETDKLSNDIPNGQEMYIEPVDGQNVALTIDEVMQSFLETSCGALYDAAEPQKVMGIVMDIANGEVLAMANTPSFDLNSPPREDAEALMSLSSNAVTAFGYEPGGLMNAFTVAKTLEMGTPEAYECTGTVSIDGEKITCDAPHGTVTNEQAFLAGCNCALAHYAEAMGKEAFYNGLESFKFGEKTGIDFSSDSSGKVTALKYARVSDIANMSYGKGMEATQLQLANAYCALINGGTLNTPRLVLGQTDAEGNITEEFIREEGKQAVSPEISNAVSELLVKMVTQTEASVAHIPGYTVGAAYGLSDYYEDGVFAAEKQTTTFMAYAPASSPRYLVMITAVGAQKTTDMETLCGPSVQRVLEEALKYSNVKPDDEETQGVQKVAVPNLIGMTLEDAQDVLDEAGLRHTKDGTGTVVGQTPEAEETVYPGSSIALEMDTKEAPEEGAEKEENSDIVTVPDFTGLTFKEARDLAIASGLKFVALGDGIVVSQYPVKETPVARDSEVVLTFRLKID